MNVSMYWDLPPVVGEIAHKQAVIICEPKNRINNLNIFVQKLLEKSQVSQSNHELEDGDCDSGPYNFFIIPQEYGPTRLIIPFVTNGKYSLIWLQDGDMVYEHTVIITDRVDRLIFVSCDLLEADTKPSTWSLMEEELNFIDDKAAVKLIHLGDQAYMDSVYKRSLAYVQKHGQSDETAQYILNEFGKRYCETWIGHHKILSHFSNYNNWDDHEIKNNLTLESDLTNPDVQYVVELATKAYNIYQESQHLTQETIISNYSWFKIMGENRDILLVSIERQSGNKSTTDIVNVLAEIINYHTNISTIILCLAGPPVPRPRGFYGLLYRKLTGETIDGPDSKFYTPSELINLYFYLFLLMDNGIKNILIVGGDMHMGLLGYVTKGNKHIHVAVASPITNHPTLDRKLASKGLRGQHNITDDITFTTLSTKANRCYVTADLTPLGLDVRIRYNKAILPDSTSKYIQTIWSFR